jgi:hypothetical protein
VTSFGLDMAGELYVIAGDGISRIGQAP